MPWQLDWPFLKSKPNDPPWFNDFGLIFRWKNEKRLCDLIFLTSSFVTCCFWIAVKISLIPFLKSDLEEDEVLVLFLLDLHWLFGLWHPWHPPWCYLIIAISNSEGADFPLTHLLTCASWLCDWGIRGGSEIDNSWLEELSDIEVFSWPDEAGCW